jgi:hypothetical protein
MREILELKERNRLNSAFRYRLGLKNDPDLWHEKNISQSSG